MGAGFIVHGWAKLATGTHGFAKLLAQLGAPAPELVAWIGTIVEVGGGALLVAGAFVTVVAVPLVVMMLVAMFTVHLQNGFSSVRTVGLSASGPLFGPPGYEINVLYIGGLVLLMLSPPAAWSIDRWRLERRASAEPRVG
jgi:putative oxidoreductase